MKPDDFRPLAKFDTFRPFRLHLKDGRTFDLLQPGLMLVLRSYLFVGILAPGEKLAIYDDSADVPYDQIERVEMLTAESTTSSPGHGRRPDPMVLVRPARKGDNANTTASIQPFHEAPMNPDDFRRLAKFDTFRPFRLQLKDGRTYDLLQPGLMLVYRTKLFVGIPAPGETRPIFENWVYVPIDQVDRVELLPTETTTSL